MRIVIKTLLLVQALLISAQSATVTWGSDIANSIGLANNTLLNGTNPTVALRALVKIGFFTISDATIASNFASANYAAITSAFVEFGTARVGDGYNTNGVWNKSTVAPDTGFVGQRIHYWAFDAATAGAATQWGIFTNPLGLNWLFPSDTPIPGSTTTDLSQAPHDNTGLIVGTFGGGPDANFGTALYRTVALVPEPSSALLSAMGLVALISRRRRNLR